MTRMFRPPELEYLYQRGRFNPIREGERYGLSRELSLAIWKRVSEDATDTFGRRSEDQARERFHDLAARISARGGRLRPDPGRLTRVGVEMSGEPMGTWAADELMPRVPGRQTLAAVEARRWMDDACTSITGEAPASASKEPDNEMARRELPGASEVVQAMAALQASPRPEEATALHVSSLGKGIAQLFGFGVPGISAPEGVTTTDLKRSITKGGVVHSAPTPSSPGIRAGDWLTVHTLSTRDVAKPQAPERRTLIRSTPSPQRGLEEYRGLALKEVLQQVGANHRLRQEIIAAAANPVRSIAGMALWREPLPDTPMTNGHALWHVAERRAATLYRHAVNSGAVDQHDPAVESALQRCGTGQPLPMELRREMEHEFGFSLAGIRIHTDAVAAQAARALDAEAFTLGENIFFAEGKFTSDTPSGRKLLAHELTHVTQALRGGIGSTGEELRVSQPSDPLEREAETVAEHVVNATRPRAPGGLALDGNRLDEERSRRPAQDAPADTPGQPLPARFQHLLAGRTDLADSIRTRTTDVGVAGVSEGRDITVRRDDGSARAEATWAHEIAHVLQRETPGLPSADVHTAELDADAFARSAAAGRTPRVHVAAPVGPLFDDDDDEPRVFISVVVIVDHEMDAAEFARELVRQRYKVYSDALLDKIIAAITKPDAPLLPPGFRIAAADVKAGEKRLKIPEDLDWMIQHDFLDTPVQIDIGGAGKPTPGSVVDKPYSKELANVVERIQKLLGKGLFAAHEADLECLRRIADELERLTAAELAELKRQAKTEDLEAFERSVRAYLAARAFAQLPKGERDKINAETDKQFWQQLQGGSQRPGQRNLDPRNAKNIEQWTNIRAQLVERRSQLGRAGHDVLELLGDPVQYAPDQYAQLQRIADKLNRFGPEDFAVCKMAKLRSLGDLDQFENLVDLYIARKAQLKEAVDKQARLPKPPAPAGSSRTNPGSMQETIDATWQGFDDSHIATMSEDERLMTAARQRNAIVKAQFAYMRDHPGETAMDFAKAATLQNSNETFDAIARDLKEVANGDANGYARWAAGAGAGAKLSGWMMAVAAVIYVLSWATGVGELATVTAFMTAMLASTITLSAIESDLRLKAASQATTPEDFKHQTTASGQAAFAVFLALGTLAVGLAIRFLAKTFFPDAVTKLGKALKRFREKIRIVGRLDSLQAEIASELGVQRQRLLDAGEQAKTSARAAADAVDKLSTEELLDKLEKGDDDLFKQPADAKKIPWRELAKTPEGAKALAHYKAQLAEMLRSTVASEIDAEVKAHVDAVDKLLDDVKRATTRDEFDAAIGRQERFLSDEEVAQRGKAREARVRDEAEQRALQQLEEETRKAETERQRLADEAKQQAAHEQAERDARAKQEPKPKDPKPKDSKPRDPKPKDPKPKKTADELAREKTEKAAKEEAARLKKAAKADYKPCFLAGTLIDTPAGPVAIESLRSGDLVIGKRPGASSWSQPILRLRDGQTTLAIEVHVGAAIIETTAAHRFHVIERGWVAAQDLAPGDVLEGASGGEATVTAVRRRALPALTATYNFGVPAEAYLVVAGAQRVLVHNDGLPNFERILYWVWGEPKVRLPGSPKVDWDGKSVWKTTSKADVDAMMEYRVKVMKRPVNDDHSFWTEDQIASVEGLQNIKTPSEIALVNRLDHHSLRPPGAAADDSDLSVEQLQELDGLVKKLPPPQPVEPWELQGTC